MRHSAEAAREMNNLDASSDSVIWMDEILAIAVLDSRAAFRNFTRHIRRMQSLFAFFTLSSSADN